MNTKLRVAVSQSDYSNAKYTRITLVPQKAKLVAILEADAGRVGYDGTVVLRADKSYDPDRVQVCWVDVGSVAAVRLALVVPNANVRLEVS